MAPLSAGDVDLERVLVVAAATKKRREARAAKKQRARTRLSEQAPIPPRFTKFGAYYGLGLGECLRGPIGYR